MCCYEIGGADALCKALKSGRKTIYNYMDIYVKAVMAGILHGYARMFDQNCSDNNIFQESEWLAGIYTIRIGLSLW